MLYACANLLPVLPLDGGRALEAVVAALAGARAAERLLDVWLAQQDYRVKELPVAHLERQHWGRKIAAFLLRKMGIKNDRTAR